MRPTYAKTISVNVPAGAAGKTLDDDGVLADVVASA